MPPSPAGGPVSGRGVDVVALLLPSRGPFPLTGELAALAVPVAGSAALLFPDQCLAALFACELAARGVPARFSLAEVTDPLFPLGELAALLELRVPSRRLVALLAAHRYPGFAALCRVAASLRSAGFGADAFDAVLPTCWDVPRRDRQRAWSRTAGWFDALPDVRPQVLAAARRRVWKGADVTALAVLEALLRFAARDGSVVVSMSLLATTAGVARSSAHRAVDRLVLAGLLERRPPRAGVSSLCLRVPADPNPAVPADPPGTAGVTVTLVPGGVPLPALGTAGDLGSDAARRGALGRAKLRVWRELGAVPSSPARVAERLGLTPQTVGAHLRALERAGWAVRDGHGGWSACPGDQAAFRALRARDLCRDLQRRRVRRSARRQWLELRRTTTPLPAPVSAPVSVPAALPPPGG